MNLPDFFALDIGNHSIKVVEIDRKAADKAKLVAAASVETPYGVVNSKEETALDKLAQKINEALDNAGIKTRKCVAALPESSIFTRLLTVPKVSEQKIEEMIYWEARQYIPIPLSEVQTDFIPIEETQVSGKKMLKILLVAAPKALINRYMKIAQKADLELIALETETIATSRAISFGFDRKNTVMVMDFGSNGTDLSVIKNGSMIFSQSIGTGSDSLTKAIANDFNLELSQAEKYKVAYGLDKSQAEGKIYNSIEPIFQIVTDEILRTINFFRTHLRDSVPEMILLVGDGSKLKKIDEYISEKTQVQVKRYDPKTKLLIPKQLEKEILNSTLTGFSVAIGLGLKMR